MAIRKTLVLLHGALGSKSQFSALEDRLRDDFEIHSLNFEGHGGRNSDRKFSIAHFEENLLELMEQKNLEVVCIFGYSMGGYVALKLAADHPGKVEKIMTLGTKFAWSPDVASEEVSRLNPLKIEEKIPRFAEQLRERHAPLDWRQVLSKTGEMMLGLSEGKALAADDFKQVPCPVLITVGSEDQMVSVEESEEIAGAIPKGTFHLFQGFKHPLEQVDTDRLAEKIKSFLMSE